MKCTCPLVSQSNTTATCEFFKKTKPVIEVVTELRAIADDGYARRLDLDKIYANVRERAAQLGYSKFPDWDTFLDHLRIDIPRPYRIEIADALSKMVTGYICA